MADPTPVPVNPISTDAHSVTEKLLGLGVNTLITALATSQPWTTWPVVSSLIAYLFNWCATIVYNWLSIQESFAIIDLTETVEVAGFNDAVKALQAAQDGKLTAVGSAQLTAAQQAYEAALEKLGHWDGSGSVDDSVTP